MFLSVFASFLLGGEQDLLIKINGGAHTEALITMLYFVCNVEYPKECLNVFLFRQRYILKVYDSARLPITLLQFLNKLIS